MANDARRAGLRAERTALEPYEPRVVEGGEPLIDVRDIAEALETLDRAG